MLELLSKESLCTLALDNLKVIPQLIAILQLERRQQELEFPLICSLIRPETEERCHSELIFEYIESCSDLPTKMSLCDRFQEKLDLSQVYLDTDDSRLAEYILRKYRRVNPLRFFIRYFRSEPQMSLVNWSGTCSLIAYQLSLIHI